jgi:hypothetical protein
VLAAHVRFALKADKKRIVSACPLGANRDRTQRNKIRCLFDQVVGAGMSGPTIGSSYGDGDYASRATIGSVATFWVRR